MKMNQLNMTDIFVRLESFVIGYIVADDNKNNYILAKYIKEYVKLLNNNIIVERIDFINNDEKSSILIKLFSKVHDIGMEKEIII
jgi:hypothetical protein